MQQYFAPQTAKKDDVFHLNPSDTHHIKTVMRMQLGDKVRIIWEEKAYLCELSAYTDEAVEVKIIELLEETRELKTKVTVALGLLKGDKTEYAIQKMTELGVAGFIPWQAKLSVSKIDQRKSAKKVQRWQAIAKEASEQAKRLAIPQIYEPQTTKDLILYTKQFDQVFIAYEDLATMSEQAAYRLTKAIVSKNVLFIIGPEGGITLDEIQLFKELANVQLITLGKRILRAETAAIFAMSLVASCEEQLIQY